MGETIIFRRLEEHQILKLDPLTSQQQMEVGNNMGISPSEHGKIARKPTLVLPDTPLCVYYREWTFRNSREGTSLPYGIAITDKEVWINDYGQAAFNDIEELFSISGIPTLRWIQVYTLKKGGQ